MNRYRMTITFQNPQETLEYYLAMHDDEFAKKYFLLQIYKLIQKEQLTFDKVIISYDGLDIVAYYEDQEYITGHLYCVPNRFKIINMPNLEQCKLENMVKRMRKECNLKIGTVKTGIVP